MEQGGGAWAAWHMRTSGMDGTGREAGTGRTTSDDRAAAAGGRQALYTSAAAVVTSAAKNALRRCVGGTASSSMQGNARKKGHWVRKDKGVTAQERKKGGGVYRKESRSSVQYTSETRTGERRRSCKAKQRKQKDAQASPGPQTQNSKVYAPPQSALASSWRRRATLGSRRPLRVGSARQRISTGAPVGKERAHT